MIIYTAKKRTSKNWRPQELSWGQFLDRLREPTRTGETVQEYLAMDADEKGKRKEKAGGFVAGELKNSQRKTENVVNRCMITLDADHARPRAWENFSILNDYRMCCYSTHSHTTDAPRLRWIIPTDRVMTPEEYPAVARQVASWLDIDSMDKTTYEVARLMYWPTCPRDGDYVFHEQDGPILSVDDVLNSYGPGEAWRNPALWPRGNDETSVPKSGAIKKAQDPRDKRGVVGAFCRVYSIHDAIDEFLPDIYTEAGPDRYTYTGGSTAGGARVYDEDTHLYSSHETDPAGGMSCNAFDLVRIHKFGHLDKDCGEDVLTVERPSYQAMKSFALDIPEVKAELEREQRANQMEEFGDLVGTQKQKVTSVYDAYKFYSVPDLTEEERKPPEFIIDGMIPVGVTFLSGAPKTRKSFLALQIAIAVASGKALWGRKVHQCDVAYLDLEGSKSRISSRTQMMMEEVPRNVFFTNKIQKRLADGLADDLRALHKEKPGIRLIIIDTFSRARGSFKANGQNAYDADVALLEPIHRMALEENIAVLFVHHYKKGANMVGDSFEMLSGTMGISGSSDCVINLTIEGKRFDGKAKLECIPRDAEGFEQRIVFNKALTTWLPEAEPDIYEDPLCKWIIENVPERGIVGRFWSYDEVYRSAFGSCTENPGRQVGENLASRRDELYTSHGIFVQLSARSHGARGIRIYNAK